MQSQEASELLDLIITFLNKDQFILVQFLIYFLKHLMAASTSLQGFIPVPTLRHHKQPSADPAQISFQNSTSKCRPAKSCFKVLRLTLYCFSFE